MDMRVEFKFLTPGMQHAEEADFPRRNALDHSIARPMAANLQNMRIVAVNFFLNYSEQNGFLHGRTPWSCAEEADNSLENCEKNIPQFPAPILFQEIMT
jgi:hypothetical protein